MSAEFEKNPIGADFDPEEFIQRIEGGESMDSLMKRKDVGYRGVESVPTSGPPQFCARKMKEMVGQIRKEVFLLSVMLSCPSMCSTNVTFRNSGPCR